MNHSDVPRVSLTLSDADLSDAESLSDGYTKRATILSKAVSLGLRQMKEAEQPREARKPQEPKRVPVDTTPAEHPIRAFEQQAARIAEQPLKRDNVRTFFK